MKIAPKLIFYVMLLLSHVHICTVCVWTCKIIIMLAAHMYWTTLHTVYNTSALPYTAIDTTVSLYNSHMLCVYVTSEIYHCFVTSSTCSVLSFVEIGELRKLLVLLKTTKSIVYTQDSMAWNMFIQSPSLRKTCAPFTCNIHIEQHS